MKLIDIAVADLRLDGENPRHDPTKGEQKIIAALLAADSGKGGDKIVQLGGDIAVFGLSPIDPLIVMKAGSAYTVLEGNRRLTAVRLLANPKLAKDAGYAATFAALAKKMTAPITQITCHVVNSRVEADHWIELRHNGEAQGRGVVDWDPPAKARHFPATKGQVANAVLLHDAMKIAYPLNTRMLADLEKVMKDNSTTVGRLLGDTDFRNRLGLVLKPFAAHYSSAELELVLMRIMADLNGSKSVADVYTGKQRADYLVELDSILPDPAKRQAHASALASVKTPPPPLPILPPPGTVPPVVTPTGPGSPTPPTTPAGGPTGGPPPTTSTTSITPPTPITKPPSAPAPQPLFATVKLTKLGSRLPLILWELQQLDLNKSPNAAAVLMRAVVELAVSQVFQLNTWPLVVVDKSGHPHDIPLRTLIETCVNTLDPATDPKKQDKKYQSVRFGLNNPNSLFSPASLHAMVHNVNIHPSANDLRSIAASYSDFLAGLDTLVP